MSKSPTIDDISEDFKIRPRDRERLLLILEKLDQSGNARFLDDREIITRALEVYLTWELEPEKFLDELKKVKLTQSQENALAAILDPKFRDDSREFYSTDVEHSLQQAARKSIGGYDAMLTIIFFSRLTSFFNHQNVIFSSSRKKSTQKPAFKFAWTRTA